MFGASAAERRALRHAACSKDGKPPFFGPGATAPLGIEAKSQAIESRQVLTTFDGGDFSTREPSKYALKDHAAVVIGSQRLRACCRFLIQGSEGVTIWRNPSSKKASYRGVQTCGSVWTCPVCAPKITEHRRVELIDAGRRWAEKGGSLALMTLTFSHDRADDLFEIRSGLNEAYKDLCGSREFRELQIEHGIKFKIRAQEVTHGNANGWHPHFHVLLFIAGDELDTEKLEQMKDEVFSLWRGACVKSGIGAPNEKHGVDIRDGSAAAKYIAKGPGYTPKHWTIEAEVTKAHQKKGKYGNRSPWDLLRESYETYDPKSTALWCEYAAAFKGQRQLVWSRGLRDHLGMSAESTDEAVAAAHDGQAVEFLKVNRSEWKVVCDRDLQGELLAVADIGDPDRVMKWLEALIFDEQREFYTRRGSG